MEQEQKNVPHRKKWLNDDARSNALKFNLLTPFLQCCFGFEAYIGIG